MSNSRPNQDAQYISERRTIDVLNVLKKISDEEHPVKQKNIYDNISTTENRNTLSNTIDEILQGINPAEHTGDNDDKYRIKFDGYDKPYEENPLVIKSLINEIKKEMRHKDADIEALKEELDELNVQKAPSITNLYYVHDFSYKEMDELIGAVVLSASIAPDEKEELIRKIVNTGSDYYKTPFYDKAQGKLKFDPYSAYNRIYSKSGELEKRLAENIQILQNALRLYTKVRFRFGSYNVDKKYIADDEEVEITPYYIVIYNDHYYVIGAWDSGKYPCHYRIDLMSEIEIIRDEDDTPVNMRPISDCKELVGRESWKPGKYMSEHIYMAYSRDDTKPRRISLKIPSSNESRYTILHDWFGDNFEFNKSASAKCEEGYEIIDVRTSPTMLVHWAMQYADFVEVLDEKVRELIREKIENMGRKYKE
ncbi:MAG: WYL domain-containing protein [Lachnospiraceae bacterium]|nr:WYL domain-containing protein [Lachnospiraceae bacterium]